MKTSIFSQSAAHRPPFPLVGRHRRVRDLLARCYDRYLQRLDLEELDDRLLADIGLTRAEVRRECAAPFWR